MHEQTIQYKEDSTMANINTVCDYIITYLKSDGEQSCSLSNLKLQKLLYYCQAWHLGIHKKELFGEDFQAWIHGPVCREIYDRFAGQKDLFSEIRLTDRIETSPMLESKDKEHVEYIMDNYAGLSGLQLEVMTHREDPWIEARRGIGEFERCENIITKESMKAYYGRKWEKINQGE